MLCHLSLYGSGDLRSLLAWRRRQLVIDSSGEALAMSLDAKPRVVKPNREELAELAGIPVPAGADGHSLVPLLADPEVEWPHVAVTLKDGSAALRDRRYRYIRYKEGGEELYDHELDPHEWRNLAQDPAEAPTLERLRARLKAELAAW